MRITPLNPQNTKHLALLVADFRVCLKALKGIQAKPNIEFAQIEIEEYLQANYPIYVALNSDEYVGYIVCRVEGTVVWVESIYVCPEYRRKNVATLLFQQAENLAQTFSEDTVYNYVHPNNDAMIHFLSKQGYSVLNLIEIRKAHASEVLSTKIQIENNIFDY